MGHNLKLEDYLSIICNGSKYSYNIFAHSIETGKLAFQLAMEFMDEPSGELLKRCGYLHDIGKTAVPLCILEKPSSLSFEEKKIMDKHVDIGVFILKQYGLEKEAAVILQHHERMDGSGYPYKLSGDEIMIESKILGLCDVYTALTLKRPYREKMTREKAFETIYNSKNQFDSNVLEALQYTLKNTKSYAHFSS